MLENRNISETSLMCRCFILYNLIICKEIYLQSNESKAKKLRLKLFDLIKNVNTDEWLTKYKRRKLSKL